MPNYKPPYTFNNWGNMVRPNNLMYRRIYAINKKFPLTKNEVQSLICPQEVFDIFIKLKHEHHVEDLPIHNSVYFRLPQHELLMPRPAIIEYESAHGFYIPKRADARASHIITIDNQEKREQVYSWIEAAVRELRVNNMVNHVVGEFLLNHAPTLWHVLVRWPALKLCFHPNLLERANDMPKRHSLYKWNDSPKDYAWYTEHKKYITTITAILLEASLLPPSISSNRFTASDIASIYSWEKANGDKF